MYFQQIYNLPKKKLKCTDIIKAIRAQNVSVNRSKYSNLLSKTVLGLEVTDAVALMLYSAIQHKCKC